MENIQVVVIVLRAFPRDVQALLALMRGAQNDGSAVFVGFIPDRPAEIDRELRREFLLQLSHGIFIVRVDGRGIARCVKADNNVLSIVFGRRADGFPVPVLGEGERAQAEKQDEHQHYGAAQFVLHGIPSEKRQKATTIQLYSIS